MRLRAKKEGPPKVPKWQDGGVIHLSSPEPEALNPKRARSKQRSRSQSRLGTQGLSVQMPESASRQSTSSQSRPSQPQQMGFPVDHLGHLDEQRDDNDSLAYRYSTEGNSLMASGTRSSTKESQPPRVGRSPMSVAIPEQSPYSAYDFLKSPMNCMDVDRLLNSVNDDMETPKDPQKEQILFSKTSLRQSVLNQNQPLTKERTSSGKNLGKWDNILPDHNKYSKDHTFPPGEHRSLAENYAPAGSLGSPIAHSRVPTVGSLQRGRVEVGPLQTFDIQKSLERQLAELPHDQDYNNSAQLRYDKDRSFLQNSIGSSMRRSLNDSVSVLPARSVATCSYSGQPTYSKPEVQTRSRQNNIYQRQQKESNTVRIDKGLVCVDPNNLKQQMRQQLRKKERVEPVQSGNIISATDLINLGNNNRRKSKGIGIKSKLQGIFSSKEPKKHAGNYFFSGNSKTCEGASPRSSQEGMNNVSKTSIDHSLNGHGTNINEQGKINATKATPLEDKKGKWRGGRNSATTNTTSLLSDNLAEENLSGGAKHAEQHLELVLPAEGGNPMYKVPSSGKAEGDQEVQENANKGAMAKVGAAARRRFNIDKLTSLARQHVGPNAKNKNSSAQIVEELGITEPLSPLNHDLGYNDSFCLGSTSLGTTSLNQSLKDIQAMFAKEGADRSQVENVLAREGFDIRDKVNTDKIDENVKKIAVSEKETPRSKEEATRDAKLLVLNSLKHKIVQELRKKRLREMAKTNGVASGVEGDREVKDAEIMKAFNQILLAAETKTKSGAVPKCDNADLDEDSGDGKIEARRKVTFAQGSHLWEMKSCYEDDGEHGGDKDNDLEHKLKTPTPDGGIMSWTQCGANTEVEEIARVNHNTLTGRDQPAELGSAKNKIADHGNRNGFTKAEAQVKQLDSSCAFAAPRCAATVPSFDDKDDDESSRSSGILSGRTNASNKKTNSMEEGNLDLVLSYSGSLLSGRSYATRDTRDTRGAESAYTEGTRDTYDTADSSYYSYYSDDYRNPRRRVSREWHRHGSRDRRRDSTGRRRGPPSVWSDYTEYTEDSRADGGCRVWD